ncbi:MAG: hypothetical protein GWN96_05865 [candidate division Zixibacteria bacterium]|nr:hypothetical protein [candidate division Zixibacteria bacterium]
MKSVFFLESIVRPYASVGGGITFSKIKNKILEVDEQGDIVERGDAKLDDRFFVFGGAGVMYGITDMISVFGEIDINYLSNLMYLPTDSTNLPLPEEESDNFFIDLKFGLNFWFGG